MPGGRGGRRGGVGRGGGRKGEGSGGGRGEQGREKYSRELEWSKERAGSKVSEGQKRERLE